VRGGAWKVDLEEMGCAERCAGGGHGVDGVCEGKCSRRALVQVSDGTDLHPLQPL